VANGGQAPIPWYQDPRIRAQIGMYLPAVLFFIKNRFHLDLTGMADTILDLILMGGALAAGIVALVKRIKDGNDPANPAAPIETPGPVEVVKRLTR